MTEPPVSEVVEAIGDAIAGAKSITYPRFDVNRMAAIVLNELRGAGWEVKRITEPTIGERFVADAVSKEGQRE